MLVILIVIPSVVVAVVVVGVLDRLGVLPRLDGGPSGGSGSFFDGIPRAALFAGMGLMAAWILAWLVLLVIGLVVLSR